VNDQLEEMWKEAVVAYPDRKVIPGERWPVLEYVLSTEFIGLYPV
jgi:hypothetical protein